MKNKILTTILLAVLTVSMLAGCGQTETAGTADTQTEESTTQTEETEETTATEEPHTHNYTEEITTEASCETDGLKTFTCECGDTYTETISATGHIFENYVSNEDATYTADGTETATCICGETDTRTAEGSMLAYTFEDMEATLYAQQTINVRDLPSSDGNKVGSLSINDEVKVTGQADNGWYRIEYNDSVAYVSNSYLGENKVEVAPPQPAAPAVDTSTLQPFQIINEGGYCVYYVMGPDNAGNYDAQQKCVEIASANTGTTVTDTGGGIYDWFYGWDTCDERGVYGYFYPLFEVNGNYVWYERVNGQMVQHIEAK